MKFLISLISLLSILLYPSIISAQINTSRSVVINSEIEKVSFDSTLNYLGENPYGYIGQRLYLMGNDEEYTYRGFVLDYAKGSSFQNNYKPEGNEYYSAGSVYRRLVGSYFDVIDVIPHPSQSESSLYSDDYFLKLVEVQSSDTLYKSYSGNSQSSFPFVVVGYFEKRESEIKGEKYVLSSTYYTERESRYSAIRVMKNDRESAQPLTFNTGEIWEVVGLTIDEDNDFRLSYLLKNDRDNRIAIPEFVMIDNPQIYSVDWANTIKNEIGEDIFNQILTRDVQIGWPKSLVLLAVGNPRTINDTVSSNIVYEQYVYGDDRYLYFENEMLRSYQGDWMFGVPYLCYDCED